MNGLIDETGNRYGRLTVVKRVPDTDRVNRKRTLWLCKCDCGKEIIARGWDLRKGHYISCGCSLHDGHGKKHGDCNTRLYSIWHNMRHRCAGAYSSCYYRYGGRGITVCDEWSDSYETFRDWALSNGYADNLTIDRIDYNGNYEPSNCRWVTIQQQLLNTSRNHFLECDGVRMTVKEWADRIGVKKETIYTRLQRGWTDEQAIKTPVANCGRRMMKRSQA